LPQRQLHQKIKGIENGESSQKKKVEIHPTTTQEKIEFQNLIKIKLK
jgi:hypothetical protein